MAAYISVPITTSAEPAPSLSSLAFKDTEAPGLLSGVTEPASAPLAAEPAQGPAGFGDQSGTDGVNPPDFVQVSKAASPPATQSAG